MTSRAQCALRLAAFRKVPSAARLALCTRPGPLDRPPATLHVEICFTTANFTFTYAQAYTRKHAHARPHTGARTPHTHARTHAGPAHPPRNASMSPRRARGVAHPVCPLRELIGKAGEPAARLASVNTFARPRLLAPRDPIINPDEKRDLASPQIVSVRGEASLKASDLRMRFETLARSHPKGEGRHMETRDRDSSHQSRVLN